MSQTAPRLQKDLASKEPLRKRPYTGRSGSWSSNRPSEPRPQSISRHERSWSWGTAYNIIDADGHILEPFDSWNKLTDPKYRDRAPRLVEDENGKRG